jgi:hypothetical protein
MNFDSEVFGTCLGQAISISSSIVEIDLIKMSFTHSKSCYDTLKPLMSKECKIEILKIRDSLITGLESKVLVCLMMYNSGIDTMDLSGCIDENS